MENINYGRLASVIKNFEMVPVMPVGIGHARYMEYTKPETEPELEQINELGEKSTIQPIGLAGCSQELRPTETIVMVAPDDPYFDSRIIDGLIMPKVVKMVHDAAEVSDEHLIRTIDRVGQRLLITKILKECRKVAEKRGGAAKWIVMGRKIFDFMNMNFSENAFIYTPIYESHSFAGLKPIVCEAYSDEIIIGHDSDGWPGLRVYIEDPTLDSFITAAGKIEAEAVEIRHTVEKVGRSEDQPYIRFVVKLPGTKRRRTKKTTAR